MPALKRPEFHALLLTRVRLLTNDSVGLTFLIPDHLVEHYRFKPGQYLTLLAELQGEQVRRCYSIASASQDRQRLEVGIKRVAGGVFSSFACELSAGVDLQVMTPQGNFLAETGGTHNYLLVAAGSGITPCLSIVKSVLAEEPESRIALVYGNRDTASIMFAADIKALKDRYLERLSVVHILSRERQDTELLNGRIDAGKLSRLHDLGMLGPGDWDAAFCCGPQAMIDAVVPALNAMGIDDSNIKRELFVTGTVPPVSVSGDASNRLNTDGVVADKAGAIRASVRIDGTEKLITVNGRNETLLQAASRQGLDLPFSCTGGMCCTCRCKLVQGEVTMDANFSLADWEVDAGFVLACQARAGSDCLVLDFDAM